jgi:hypothetical protein
MLLMRVVIYISFRHVRRLDASVVCHGRRPCTGDAASA